jgi:carboxylesterase
MTQKPSAMRWCIEMDGSKQVLLLHGFTGSSHDMVPLSEELLRHGMTVEVVTLAGHDTKVEDLIRVRWQEWVTQVRESLARLQDDRPKIIVALSMGTFIATILAAEESSHVDGLVLLAPAFVLKPIGRLGAALSLFGLHRILPSLKKLNGSDICDPKARRESRAYNEIPVRSLAEFEELRKVAIPYIKNVECPVFVGLGAHDHTVDNNEVTKLLKGLGSKRVEWHTYPKSGHVLPVDFDHQKLSADIVHFIENL